jgi:tRNA(Ile)-lysidine synthase TilS/MesJ
MKQQFEKQARFEKDLERYGKEIRNILEAIIKDQLKDIDPNEKIGVALSGGIDSK